MADSAQPLTVEVLEKWLRTEKDARVFFLVQILTPTTPIGDADR
jgi:hypothetical protein